MKGWREVKASYWIHRFSRFVQNATPKRLANLILVRAEYKLGITRVRSLPPLIHIDPLNYCNLRCPVCPTGRGTLGRHRGKMPMELFQAIVDEISDRVFFLNLYNWGEPLLHPQIFDMVEYAASKGLSVRISSNLNSMTLEQARLMVESGLEELLVNLDGATQETYAIYRVGGSLARVVENIREITRVKKRFNTPFPLITARVLVTKYNYDEISQIRALAWSLNVDRFVVSPIHVNLRRSDDINRWVVQKQKSVEFAGLPRKPRKCDQLWFNLTISWDGGVFPCCWFHEQEYDFGNVYEEGSLIMIWNNDRFVQSRNFVIGKNLHSPGTICGQCKGYPQYYYSY